MVAVSVFAVLLGIALPRVDVGRWEADAAQRRVRGALQRAQRTAIQRQYDVAVSIDTTNRRLRIVEDADADRVMESTDPVQWFPLEESARFAAPPTDIQGGTPAPYAGANVVEILSLPTVVFLRNGAATSDLRVYTTVRGGLAKHFRGVILTQSTGRTDLYTRSSNSWQLSIR